MESRVTTALQERRNMLLRLRLDAVARGLFELAEAYGWSAIRLGDELIKAGSGRG